MLESGAVKRADPGRMRDIIAALPDHLEEGLRRGTQIRLDPADAERMFVVGMGGSGIAGEVFAAWTADRSRVPIRPVHDYRLPRDAKSGDVLVAMSYSGTTEETIAATAEGVKLGCRLVAVTSGGALADLAARSGAPVVKVPTGFPPRGTFGYQLGILAALGANFVLGDVRVELERGIAHLRALRKSLRSDVRLRSNRAKSLAVRLRNRIPVFYAAPPYGPIARRWQTQFNENAKAIAFTSSFPEADHNELVGWSADSRARSLVPVFLRDFDESSEIRRRLDASASLFSRWTQVEQVRDRGKTLLDRMLGLLYLGDFTSLYLAVLRKVDPLPVAPIEQLKARLKR